MADFKRGGIVKDGSLSQINTGEYLISHKNAVELFGYKPVKPARTEAEIERDAERYEHTLFACGGE